MSEEQALIVIRKCISEVQKRLVINQPRFSIKMVSKNGIKVIDAADSCTPGKPVHADDPIMSEVPSVVA